MAISLPPKGNDAKVLGSYFTPLKVQAQSTPNMTVAVAEGAFWTADNEHQEYIGGTSPTISAPTADAKWVLVTVTKTGALNIVNGVSSTTPILPAPATYKDELPLAAIFIGDTVTGITNDMIYDIRPQWQIPPDSVSQSQLGDFATTTQLSNGLAAKAEVDGTNSETFTISVGTTSTNNSGFFIDRSAGPDVSIRFNETATSGSPAILDPRWEFTNDGTVFNAIGVASGDYYLKTVLNAGALDFLYYTKNDLSSAGVLDSRYYTETESDALFSLLGHTHPVGDITGLLAQVSSVNTILPVLGDVSLNINDILDVQNLGPSEAHVLRYSFANSQYENSLLDTNDLSDVDTVSTMPIAGDVLVNNGGTFINRALLKSDISDFLGTEFLLLTNVAGDPPVGDGPPDSNGVAQTIYGEKTFKDGIVIETSLTVLGGNTTIQTNELNVSDDHIHLNFGEIGDGVAGGSGTAGLRIDRGFAAGSPAVANPYAVIQWDESAGQWELGIDGSAQPVLTGAHTHIAAQVTDFAPAVTAQIEVNNLDTIQDVLYTIAPVADRDILLYDSVSNKWGNLAFDTQVTAELGNNPINALSDVTTAAETAQDFLQWSGTEWVNIQAVKADISDFVETDYLHTDASAEVKAGDLTISGDLTTNGDFTVGGGVGTKTTIDSETVNILDSVITLNAGETGSGVSGGSGTAGFDIDRGTAASVALWWSELAKTWFAHHTISTGSPASPTLVVGELSFIGHQHVIADLTDLLVTANEINTLTGIQTSGPLNTVQNQLDTKFDGTFIVNVDDTVGFSTSVFNENILKYQNTANPTVTNGTLISLGTTDTLISIAGLLSGVLVLINDNAIQAREVGNGLGTEVNLVHRTTIAANTPPTQGPAAYDNEVIVGDSGVTTAIRSGTVGTNDAVIRAGAFGATDDWKIYHEGNFVPGDKADKITPALANNLAGLDGSGNLTDSGIIVNDSGVLTTEIWTADKIDTTKADKITPALANNLAGLDINGNLTDSGIIVNDSGVLTTEIWTAAKIDTTKADKVASITTNLVELDGSGNLADSGIIVNDSGVAVTDLWSADKIDTTKLDKVGGATLANFAEFDNAGNVLDGGSNATTFAAAVHTHVSADITDLNAGVITAIGLSSVGDLSDVTLTGGGGSPPAGAANGEVLLFAGGSFVNTDLITFLGNTFVNRSDSVDELITGQKTFQDDITFSGNLTVSGANANIDVANLEVRDSNITLNYDYSGTTSGSSGGGITVVRNAGTGSPPSAADPAALIVWEDSLSGGKWTAGIDGFVNTIALEAATVMEPAYDIQTSTGVALYTPTFVVSAPASGKANVQVFVNGIKQIEGPTKAYTITYGAQVDVTFNSGSEPTTGADIEFYGFGVIG